MKEKKKRQRDPEVAIHTHPRRLLLVQVNGDVITVDGGGL